MNLLAGSFGNVFAYFTMAEVNVTGQVNAMATLPVIAQTFINTGTMEVAHMVWVFQVDLATDTAFRAEYLFF